ncbi:MAG: AAA family ATPase [Deltaproteobacteria bacterium]|nr:AAA family ATPase [Deltaproteobacteria bacterium]
MTHRDLVEVMSKPSFYLHEPDRVDLIQTHISYIFIAGDRVYKVKKAVDFGFLDFTSLAKREHYCREELRLNRRLAPEMYLDVLEIREDSRGELHIDGEGHTVEYALEMKRLPQERMLKKLLGEGAVDKTVMDKVAARLADFHRRAATGGQIDRIGSLETVRLNHEENFDQTQRYVGLTLPAHQFEFIRTGARAFIENQKALFDQRVADHKIRDCHGDLHLEHICITDGIVIFDCIEFNERFRYEDVAAEAAFLAMDLDYNGYPDYAQDFVESYIRHASDPQVAILLNFYKCYYAYVRGKVTSFRLDEAAIAPREREAAAGAAARYFDLAYSYAARLGKQALILMAGLMGTGKSALAASLGGRLNADVIRMDVLRKTLIGIEPTEKRLVPFHQGPYSGETTRKTYAAALERAEQRLQEGRTVIVDASFGSREQRERFLKRAEHLGVDAFVIECVCDEATVRKRLDSRLADGSDASDGRWEIYEAQRDRFDAITDVPEGRHLVIDTARSVESCTHEVLVRRQGIDAG